MKFTMTRSFILLALVLAPTAMFAQGPPTGEANREAMKKFDYLAGKWKGEATIQMGPGPKQTIQQSEDVQFRLGGVILVVEGTGRGKLPGTAKEGVVFNAFAVMSYDAQKKEYAMRAYRAEGMSVDAWLKPADKGFTWGFAIPEQKVSIKYAMTLSEKGVWNEVGEVSRDGGKTWFKFFEMNLTREKE